MVNQYKKGSAVKVKNKKHVQIQRYSIRIYPKCISIAELISRYGTTTPMINSEHCRPTVVKLSPSDYLLTANYLAFIRHMDRQVITAQIDQYFSEEVLVRTAGWELCDLFVRQRKIEPDIEQMLFEQSELIFGKQLTHKEICAMGHWCYDDLKYARRLGRVKTGLPTFCLTDFLYESGLSTKEGVYNEF